MFTPHTGKLQVRHVFVETNWLVRLLLQLVIGLPPQSNCWIQLGTDGFEFTYLPAALVKPENHSKKVSAERSRQAAKLC